MKWVIRDSCGRYYTKRGNEVFWVTILEVADVFANIDDLPTCVPGNFAEATELEMGNPTGEMGDVFYANADDPDDTEIYATLHKL